MRYERYANIFVVLCIACFSFFCYSPIIPVSPTIAAISLALAVITLVLFIHFGMLAHKAKKKKRKIGFVSDMPSFDLKPGRVDNQMWLEYHKEGTVGSRTRRPAGNAAGSRKSTRRNPHRF